MIDFWKTYRDNAEPYNSKTRSATKRVSQAAMCEKEGMQGGGGCQDCVCHVAEGSEWGTMEDKVLMDQ